MSLIRSNFPTLTNFFNDEPWSLLEKNSKWMPAVNVVDNKNDYEIEVAAPGLRKEDFTVEMENNVLTIRGESTHEEEEKKKNYTRREFSSRSFTKSFTLPDNVKEEKISAKYKDGVLRLQLNKSKVAEPRKLEVAID